MTVCALPLTSVATHVCLYLYVYQVRARTHIDAHQRVAARKV